MQIVGKQKVNYVSKKTNQPVVGMTFHVVGEMQNVEGKAVHTVYISSKAEGYQDMEKIPLGTDIKVYYNQWGNAESIVPIRK